MLVVYTSVLMLWYSTEYLTESCFIFVIINININRGIYVF